MATLLAFLPVVLAMQAVPGPDTMLVVGRGIGQGSRVALWTAIGAVSAGLVQLPLLAVGVASLVSSSPLAFEVLRHAGAIFLIWLGLRLLLGRNVRRTVSAPLRTISRRRAFGEGVVSNLANPNVLVFMLAFLPQFVDAERGTVAGQLLVLGGLQKLTGLIILGGTALVAGRLGDWLSRRTGYLIWQERFAGAVILGLGLRLLLTGDSRTFR
jgi:threonine/homoserine/homoserine lactone efflux protein